MVGGQPLPIINKGRLGVWACDQLGHTTRRRGAGRLAQTREKRMRIKLKGREKPGRGVTSTPSPAPARQDPRT